MAHQPPPPPAASATPPSPALAPRHLFLDLRPSPRVSAAPARSDPPSAFDSAVARIRSLTDHLTGDMQSSLIATLTVMTAHHPSLATTTHLATCISDASQTTPEDLLTMADTITRGLRAFTAKSTPPETPAPPPSDSSRSKKSSQRSHTVRTACRTRDASRCRICTHKRGVSAHIIPFSLRGPRAVDFWAFLALFRGAAAAGAIRAATLPDTPDALANVLFLCPNCHDLFDAAMLALLPRVLDAGIAFPYDPAVVREYAALVDFPAGMADASVLVLRPDGTAARVLPGHEVVLRTMDPQRYPLPHPLLLQVQAVVARMLVLKAAAGYPVLQGGADSEADTLCCEEEYMSDGDGGGSEVDERPRTAAVVLKELGARMAERRVLMDSRLAHV